VIRYKSLFTKVVLGCLVIQAPVFFVRPAAAEEPPRALWVWDTKTPQVASSAEDLINFCRDQHIQTVFISCYNLPDRLVPSYRRFNRMAHDKGLKVHALSGDPRWTRRRFHGRQLAWAQSILDFNSSNYLDAIARIFHNLLIIIILL